MTSPRFRAVQVFALFCLLSFCGAQWLGTDICVDRGGVITAYYCETAKGDVVALISLVGPQAILAVATIVAIGIGAIWAIVVAIRRRMRDA